MKGPYRGHARIVVACGSRNKEHESRKTKMQDIGRHLGHEVYVNWKRWNAEIWGSQGDMVELTR